MKVKVKYAFIAKTYRDVKYVDTETVGDDGFLVLTRRKITMHIALNTITWWGEVDDSSDI